MIVPASVVSALHALLEDGLVTMEVISHQDKPSRKIYAITETGRQALREWTKQPVVPGISLRTSVMRLILASHLSHTGLITHLQQRREQVAAHQLTLHQTAMMMDEGMELGERLVFDYGLAAAAAELAWLDRTLARLFQPSLCIEVTQDGFSIPAV